MHESQKIKFDNTFAIKIDAQDHTKKIAIENSIQINKYWTRIGETGALITCWWECKLAHFRWQLAIGVNIFNVYTLWASDSTSKNYPTDTCVCVKWYLLEVIYYNIVCNGKKLEKWDALVNSSVVHHITKCHVVAFRRRKEGPGRLGVLNSDAKCFLRCKQGTEESEE